jgi:hypothetical protein
MSPRRSVKMFAYAWLLACSALLACGAGAYAAPQSGSYKVVRRMPIGGDGNWDYLRVDPDAHRIYVSRGTHMMVVDEVSGKVIGDIPDTMGIHGVALATDLGKGFTSNCYRFRPQDAHAFDKDQNDRDESGLHHLRPDD